MKAVRPDKYMKWLISKLEDVELSQFFELKEKRGVIYLQCHYLAIFVKDIESYHQKVAVKKARKQLPNSKQHILVNYLDDDSFQKKLNGIYSVLAKISQKQEKKATKQERVIIRECKVSDCKVTVNVHKLKINNEEVFLCTKHKNQFNKLK